MVRPSFVVVLAALLSASVAASTRPIVEQGTAQTPAPKPAPAKPAPAKPAPSKPATTTKPAAPATDPAAAAAPAPAPKPAAPPKPATDIRLKTAYTQGAQVSENVMYLQGPRQRVEFPGVVSLDQCDLKRSVMLNTTAKKYRVQPYAEPAAASAPAAPEPPAMPLMGPGAGRGGQAPAGGVISYTTTLTDTLERQPMFGLEARHIKSILIKDATPRACDKSPMKVEVDAWYLDLPEQSACVRPPAQAARPPADSGACTDRIETKTVGDVKLGFPVKVTTTTTAGEGDKVEVTTSTQEVKELEITRLDKALFEVPKDYTEATSSAEIVPSVAAGGTLTEALFGSTADGTSSAAPKKAGVTRIGVLEPVNHTDRSLSVRSLRQQVVSKFNKGNYEALALAGSSPAEIEKDAARLQCDYILLTDINEVKTSKPGGLGGTLKKVSGGDNKDKHDVKLEYKLYAVGATQAPKISGKASASTGGFGVGSALKLAAFAGQMYLGMMGMGMMNPMMGMGGMGMMAGGLFDPRMSAMTQLATSMGGMGMNGGVSGMPGLEGLGGGDPSEQDMKDTVAEALGNAAKATMEQLSKPVKK